MAAPIQKILIANRGEIACRIIRAAQKLGKQTVAIYHEADEKSLYVRLADEAVRIEGTSPVSAYLSAENIINACKKTGADALHPGFGFLSENATFAKKVQDAGIHFIGPDPQSIAMMGDKIESKRLAQKAGVSTIPGFDGEIENSSQALNVAESIGFPVMIKASAGGGGKGLRVIHKPDECESAFTRTTAEAKAAFDDGRVFIEKFIEKPRHIEIQILADAHGNIVHLGERECSIQRRHQKIIEEAPSPFLDEKMRADMGQQAIALARAVNYKSAGTVEFVVGQDRRFYFLEMNTRIQVEHPVTEMITGLDIVAAQIRIAEGEKLGYNQRDISISGHSIECRLCAEDADHNFSPATGRVLDLHTPDEPWLRLDSGVAGNDLVTANFDSMLAKLIVHGENRKEAVARMIDALSRTAILGVTTNMAYLRRVLSHPDFLSGALHTGFLADNEKALNAQVLGDEDAAAIIAAALLSNSNTADRRHTVSAVHAAMGGWRN